jgi:hypothetical protein
MRLRRTSLCVGLRRSILEILQYVEDLRRGLNADIGRKDFFEMASILITTGWIHT